MRSSTKSAAPTAVSTIVASPSRLPARARPEIASPFHAVIVFSQQRRMLIKAPGSLGEFNGQTGLFDHAQSGMVDFLKHVSGQNLGVGENIGDVVDGAAGHAMGLQIGHPVGDGLGQEDFLQQRHQFAPAVHPVTVGGVLRIVPQVCQVHCLAETLPNAFRTNGYVDVLAILTHESLIGHQGWMGGPQAFRGLAVGEEIRRLVGQPGNLRVHHRDVYVLTRA